MQQAIGPALDAITPQDARHFFALRLSHITLKNAVGGNSCIGRATVGAGGEGADAGGLVHQGDQVAAEGVEERGAGLEEEAARVVVAQPSLLDH